MCGPWVIPLVQVGAAVLGAYSMVQQGQAQRQAADYNAKIGEINAQYAEQDRTKVQEQAALDRRRRGIQAQQDVGEIRARAAAMGLDSEFGTFDDLQSDVRDAYRIDRSILGKNELANLEALDREAWSYRAGATLQTAQGRSAERAGHTSALGSLLDSGATISSRWIKPSTATKAPKTLSIGG